MKGDQQPLNNNHTSGKQLQNRFAQSFSYIRPEVRLSGHVLLMSGKKRSAKLKFFVAILVGEKTLLELQGCIRRRKTIFEDIV